MLINFDIEKESSKSTDHKISYFRQYSLRSEYPKMEHYFSNNSTTGNRKTQWHITSLSTKEMVLGVYTNNLWTIEIINKIQICKKNTNIENIL